MCIHGDKSQPERDWVLNGELRTKYCPYSILGMGKLSVKDQEVNIFCFTDDNGVSSQSQNFCQLFGSHYGKKEWT